MEGELSAKLIREKTGRQGYHLRGDAPTEHVEVQDFVLALCQDETSPLAHVLEISSTAKRIYAEFQAATRIGITGEYYRGRRFQRSEPTPISEDLFAPSAGEQGAGRYNESGNRVLYLSRTPYTVSKECPPKIDKAKLFIQKFCLHLPKGRMLALPLDLEARFPHLHYVLLDSEYVPDETARFDNVRNPYRATHFLAYLASLSGVCGIEYPSIRAGIQGDPSRVNFVLLGEAVSEAEAMAESVPFLFIE